MSRKVNIERIRYDGPAVCETCGGLHPNSTRERCRLHADRNPGHRVQFVVEECTIYTAVILEPRNTED